jgi:prepilin peptidase CpaA
MSTTQAAPPKPLADDLGIDRAFIRMLSRLPLIATGFVLAAWAGQQVSPYAPVVLLCAAMILAAVIDGWKFKVPNWLTLSLILAGWGLGTLNGLGVTVGPGPVTPALRDAFPASGGLGASLLGTLVGFGLLFPVYLIGGMGQGDVKMQTGFGAWVGALYGAQEGLWTIVYAVLAGYLIGGVLGLLMMLARGQLHKNLSNVKEIFADFRVMAQAGVKAAAQRAQSRRPTWHRLPYGIPLCIGFVGYLAYLHLFAG